MSQFCCALCVASKPTVRSAPLWLRSEKKSVYWLDPPSSDSSHVMDGGIAYECQLHYENHDLVWEPFFVGGFQLISNARQVDVFLISDTDDDRTQTNESSPGKFLTSVKGLPTASTNDAMPRMFKAQCVIPGGPRRVHAVRLEFHLVQPSVVAAPQLQLNSSLDVNVLENSTNNSIPFRLEHIRWTLRISTPVAASSTDAPLHSSSNPNPLAVEPVHSSTDNKMNFAMFNNALGDAFPHQSSDVMAAVSGLAMALKSTEERLQQQSCRDSSTVQAQLMELLKQMGALMVLMQRIGGQQERDTALILSRQQHLEERLDVLQLELRKARTLATTEGEENAEEEFNSIGSQVHDMLASDTSADPEDP